MTSSDPVIDRLLTYAAQDERVRAVYMDGSRTDPSVPPDPYQDYDVVFVVTDPAPYIADPDWIRVFGDVAMVQEPDKPDFGWGDDCDLAHGYAWLIIFQNGIRIDLGLQSTTIASARFTEDALRLILLDKDDLLPAAPEPSNVGFWATPPTEGTYLGCCNEFWWCLNNVAKAVVREQYPAAITHLQDPVRGELLNMLGWYAGGLHGWQVTVGKQGKFLRDVLPAADYALLLETFPRADAGSLWTAIEAITTLFRRVALMVAEERDYRYPQQWDAGMTSYLQAMRRGELPGEMQLTT